MIRPTALFGFTLVAVALIARPALAQHPGAPPAAAAAPKWDPNAPITAAQAAPFLGNWEGSMRSDHAPNSPTTIRIKRATEWDISLELNLGQTMNIPKVSEVQVDKSSIRWKLPLMDSECTVVAIVEGDVMNGELTCHMGAASFSLTRKK